MIEQRMIYKYPGDFLIDKEFYEIKIIYEVETSKYLDNGYSLTPLEARMLYEKNILEATIKNKNKNAKSKEDVDLNINDTLI